MLRTARVVLALVVAPALALSALSVSADAHEERPAEFPDGTGKVPTFLGYENPKQRVVCKPDSDRRIAALPDGRAKKRSGRLLKDCSFRSIQSAINTIKQRDTSIYVLPGVYHETKWAKKKRSEYCSHLATESDDPLVSAEYIGSFSSPDTAAEDDGTSDPIALSYADQRRCRGNLNLISVFGDKTPKNDSISCDSKFCGTQVVGTGRKMTDVIVDNKFQKLNAIRFDRAGGALVRNMTFQQAEFNAVYILETDGFVIDKVIARGNDEYGVLAFASDHGLVKRGNFYYNGDSGVYPGSASDLNADKDTIKVDRYAIEIRNNRSHDNTLGYSGTAGNSVWAHHNKFYDNATGIATDSLFPGHPGLPQDHARWNKNEIYSNNTNYYTMYVDEGVCELPMEERGYINGTVCPVVPTPVGTGVLIAGGNFNSTDHNWIYDNWRYGTMQFWIPAPLRDETDPEKLYDTSNGNQTFANEMGLAKDGTVLPNGMDHWWDDEGDGNCWQDNKSSYGEATNNFLNPLNTCDNPSVFTPGMSVKDAGFLSCSQYDRHDPNFRHPPECEWFDSPERPANDDSETPAVEEQDADSLVGAPVLTAAGLLILLGGMARKRRAA